MPRRIRDSRRAILDAASTAFAAHGFAGASVDAIARRARVNKAMIYYHFDSKLGLYREILRGMFDLIYARLRDIAASTASPDEKIAAFLDTMVREGEGHPDFPRIMAREIADRARHLDPETVRVLARLPRTVADIVSEGVTSGRFVRVDPLVTYFILFGPVMLYLMSAPVRRVAGRLRLIDTDRLRTEAFISHLQMVARRTLLSDAGRAAGESRTRAGRRRRSNPFTVGEQA